MAQLLNLLPWRRRRLEQELDRELRDHMERRVDDLRQAGATDTDARRQAALEFGGLTQVREDVRETWGWRWLDHVARDVRYAFRTLRRSPAFAATALLSLALGTGVNAAIFSLIDQVVLRPLPVNNPTDWCIWCGGAPHSPPIGASGDLMSYPLCRDLQEQTRILRRDLLPPLDDGEPLDRAAGRARSRGDRVGIVLPGARCTPRTRAPLRCLRRSSAGRPSGDRALPRLLDEPSRRLARGGRTQGSRQQVSDDGDRRGAGWLPRRRSARPAHVVGSGRDDRAGGEHRRLLGSLARSPRGVAATCSAASSQA